MITLVVATGIVLFFFTGCDKYHRDRYIGDWDFMTERVYYASIDTHNIPIRIDTIYYSGKISLGPGSALLIQYTENDEISAYMSASNPKSFYAGPPLTYKNPGEPPPPNGYFESKDKLRLQLIWGHFNINERDMHEYIYGTKTKKGKR